MTYFPFTKSVENGDAILTIKPTGLITSMFTKYKIINGRSLILEKNGIPRQLDITSTTWRFKDEGLLSNKVNSVVKVGTVIFSSPGCEDMEWEVRSPHKVVKIFDAFKQRLSTPPQLSKIKVTYPGVPVEIRGLSQLYRKEVVATSGEYVDVGDPLITFGGKYNDDNIRAGRSGAIVSPYCGQLLAVSQYDFSMQVVEGGYINKYPGEFMWQVYDMLAGERRMNELYNLLDAQRLVVTGNESS